MHDTDNLKEDYINIWASA